MNDTNEGDVWSREDLLKSNYDPGTYAPCTVEAVTAPFSGLSHD
jgi:hypothetical protein